MNKQFFAQKGIVLNKQREILFIQYSESKYLPGKLNGKYALPGGKIQIGEKPDQSIISEVKDETGILCIPGIPFYTWNWEYEKEDDVIQINAIMRVCKYESGKPNLTNKQEKELKIVQVVWVPLEKVLNLDLVSDEKVGIEFFIKNVDVIYTLGKQIS